MKSSPITPFQKSLFQSQLIGKLHQTVVFVIALLFSIHSLYAQDEKDAFEFLHSGTVKGKSKTVKVPIEIWNDFILLKVKVNGNEATFMWDNGFSVSGIDNSLVAPYKLLPYQKEGQTQMTDGNNVKVNVDFAVCPTFEIDGITISNTPFIKLDFRTFTMTKDLKIEGIIGSSIINKLNWKFDFDNNYVEISKKPFAVNPTDLVLPFKIIESSNTHVMPIAFDGNETDCQVDFGYNSAIIEINTTNAKLFSKANATKAFGPSSISVSGLAPIDTIYTIKDNFSWTLSGQKLDVKPKVSFTKATYHVVIGNKIFRDTYNLIINTSGKTVYALSNRTAPHIQATDKAFGYKLHNVDGTLKVMSINANADTVNSDVKLLDEVLSINGKTQADFDDNYSLRKYQKELLDKREKMVLKFKGGKEISITPQPGIEYEFKNEKELW